jgi:hypothetical protein
VSLVTRCLWSALMTLGDDLIGREQDLDRAISLVAEAVAVLRSTGERGRAALSVAVAMAILGGVTRLQGDHERATIVLQEGVDVSREVGNTWAEAMSLQDIGQVALERGATERAAALFTDCFSLAQELADSRRVAECLEGFGEIAGETGLAERAARLLAAAQVVRDANGSTIEPVDRAMQARSVAPARQRLGETAFTAAWDAGAATPLERSIELALAPGEWTGIVAEAPTVPKEAAMLSAREWEVVELIAGAHESADRGAAGDLAPHRRPARQQHPGQAGLDHTRAGRRLGIRPESVGPQVARRS